MTEDGGSSSPGVRGTPAFTSRLADVNDMTRRITWQCPYCAHSLEYASGDREAAEFAANSHLKRRHSETKAIALLR